MKVRFENCEVELWKLRKGVVVLNKYGYASHINLLGEIWDYTDVGNVVDVNITYHKDHAVCYDDTNSYRLTWVEPT